MKTGKVHLHYKTVTSTNDIAYELISKTSPITGTAISADFQSRGRGQFDRTWIGSPEENIATTVIFVPEGLEIEDQFYLNKCIALAVRATVSDFVNDSVKTEIKWPNDILADGKKISGILIQNLLQGHKYKYSLVGIGINIMQTKWPEMDIQPTSVALNSSKTIDKNEILHILFHHCDYFFHLLEKRDFEQIDHQYHQYLYNKGQNAKVTIFDQEETVVIRGVDKFGRICVDRKGNIEIFEFGSLKILYKN